MKTLSLIQPWAGLLVLGMKINETRSWATKYRGPLAIHASAKINSDGKDLIETLKQNFVSRFAPDSPALGLVTATGVILGELNLVDVVPTDGLFFEYPEGYWEAMFGDFSPGRFAWKCENPIIYDEPVLAKGKLQLWEWDKPVNLKQHAIHV